MEAAGQYAEAFCRKAQQQLRGIEARSRFQGPAEITLANAGNGTHCPRLVQLQLSLMVAGIAEHQAITIAVVLIGLTVAENDKGIVLMARIPSLRGDAADSVGNRTPLRLPLHGMPSVKTDAVPGAEGQIEAGRGSLSKPDGISAAIADPDRPGDNIPVRKHPVQQLCLEPHSGICQDHGEGFSLLICVVESSREPFEGVCSLTDFMTHIAQIHAQDTVVVIRKDTGQAEVSPVGSTVLLRHRVQRKAS